jgi:phosphodiesterase/alkaline phosphatase D-like protein
MNKNTLLILALAVVVILGVALLSVGKDGENNLRDETSTTTNPGSRSVAGAPIVSTDAKATPSESEVVVTGKVTPNGAFATYWYEYGTSANLGAKTPSQSLGSGYVAIAAPAYIRGLTADTKYYFRLVAENQYGKVAGSQYSFETVTDSPPLAGSAPDVTTSGATGISRSSAKLSGKVNPNNAATQYWFEYGKSANLGSTSAFGNLPKDADGLDYSATRDVSLPISDLEAGTTYYYRLNAQNQFGTVNGEILNFKTVAPPAASLPTVKTRSAINVSSTTAALRGEVNPGGAATNYWFEYSTDSLLGSVLVETTDSTNVGAGRENMGVEAAIDGLTPDTTYYFRIVARNSQGTVMGEKLSFKTE